VNSVTPSSGPDTGGTKVKIIGRDFREVTAVEFGGVPAASWERISELEIIAITPPHAAANMLEVTVTTAEDGKSEGLGCPPGKPKKCKGDTFTWGPLVVSSISPNNGPVAGGTLVHVRGQGLGSETEIQARQIQGDFRGMPVTGGMHFRDAETEEARRSDRAHQQRQEAEDEAQPRAAVHLRSVGRRVPARGSSLGWHP
jgi:hypothetical protein